MKPIILPGIIQGVNFAILFLLDYIYYEMSLYLNFWTILQESDFFCLLFYSSLGLQNYPFEPLLWLCQWKREFFDGRV